MHARKRFYQGAALATAAALTLAGCGFGGSGSGSGSGDGGDSGGDVTLNLLVPTYSDASQENWNTVIEGFEAANEGITVNLEVQSWDNLESVIATKVQGNQAPDIYNGGPFAGFAADDLLYDVAEVTSPETFSDFQESFVENATIDGTVYGLPWIASARALFVNDDLFDEAGVEVPTTWEELNESAAAISALGGGIAGYGLPLGSEEAQAEAAIWIWGGGGSLGDAEALTIDAPENLAGVEAIQALIEAGGTQADPGATNRSPLMSIFIDGMIGAQIGLPPTVGQIAETNPDLNYSIHPIPTQDGSPVTLGVADHLMAFKNDGSKQEAITAFFDYLFSADVYTEWVGAEGFLPTTISGAEALGDDEALQPFLELLPDAQFYPTNNSQWAAADSAFKSLFGQVATGGDAEAVLSEIQQAAENG